MKSGVYAIINNANNKMYIGQTTDFNRRKREHLTSLRKNKHLNEHLQNAWNKYGEINFKFCILKECSIDEMDDTEKKYISLYSTYDCKKGYNKDYGGNLGKIYTEETRRKMSENHYDCSGENNPLFGTTRPQEVRDKISKNRIENGVAKGEKNPFYGKKHSLESRKKISANNIGRKAWNKGKKYYQVRGNKNPNALYTLWDNQKVHYHKYTHLRNNKDLSKIIKCFLLKYDGKDVKIGGFIDFLTPTLLYNIIKGEDNLGI